MRSWFTSIACVCLLLVPILATAAPKPPDARSLYQSGTKHYNLSEFAEALADFKEAYRLRPDPVFLYNIAQCHRRLGDAVQAGTFYRSFLREMPAAPNRADIERLIVEMDQAVAAKEAEQKARVAEEERGRQAELERQRVAAAPTTNAVVARPPEKKPLTRRAWFWGVIGGGAAVAVTAVTLGLVLGIKRDPRPTFGTAEVQ